MDLNGFQPYITVVVAVRNDNEGGNTLERTQAFLSAWLGQAKRYGLRSEIIVVEWNPPADQPKLGESLTWPVDTSPCEVRFIEVPPGVHQRYPNAQALPLHRMMAKNVGIRRARGEFVLATNIDSFFSSELMEFLAGSRLESRTLYRMDRCDVRSGISAQATADDLVAFCQNNIRGLVTAEGAFEVAEDGLRRLEENDIVAPSQGIRLGAGWYPVEISTGEGAPFRWIGSAAEVIFRRPPGSGPGLLMDVEVGPSAANGTLKVEVADSEGALLASTTLQGRSKLRLSVPDQISSGLLRFRLLGDSIPLASNPRFLKLRMFGLCWECSPWSPQSFNPDAANPGRPAGIRVLSMEPRQIQLALSAGEAASLDSIGVRLTDRNGNVVFQVASDRLQLGSSKDYLVALDLGFRFSGHDSSKGGVLEGPAWFLEVVATRPATNWGDTNQTPSPFSNQMKAAAHLHTNACDEFMLLAREDWFALRGFAEFPIWSKHIDSLFCYSAHHAGVRELVLKDPMRMFHIEHCSESGSTPESGVRVIGNAEFTDWIQHMRRLNRPVIFTLGNWGLADEKLSETIVECARLSRQAPV